MFFAYYEIFINGVSNILNQVGININTVPVLDLKRKNSHNIIGTRSFSQKNNMISKLGKTCIDLYKKNKICTVIKHIPGHGLSRSDSHFKTPIIKPIIVGIILPIIISVITAIITSILIAIL